MSIRASANTCALHPFANYTHDVSGRGQVCLGVWVFRCWVPACAHVFCKPPPSSFSLASGTVFPCSLSARAPLCGYFTLQRCMSKKAEQHTNTRAFIEPVLAGATKTEARCTAVVLGEFFSLLLSRPLQKNAICAVDNPHSRRIQEGQGGDEGMAACRSACHWSPNEGHSGILALHRVTDSPVLSPRYMWSPPPSPRLSFVFCVCLSTLSFACVRTHLLLALLSQPLNPIHRCAASYMHVRWDKRHS